MRDTLVSIVIYLVLAALSFLLGTCVGKHYVASQVDVTDTMTHQVDTTHTVVTTVTTKSPDGGSKVVQTVDSVTHDDVKSKSEEVRKTVDTLPKNSVSFIVAEDFTKAFGPPVYGVHVTRSLIGPITVGIFGLTNATVGVSIGVTF